MLSLPPSTTIDVHLRIIDSTRRRDIKQDFSFQRGTGTSHNVEFDAPRGTYRVGLVAPATNCGFIDFLSFISEAPRTVHEDLVTTPPKQVPIVLFEGLAPDAFLAADPQFILFPKDTKCDTPVPDPPPPANVRLENDGSSFYVWMSLDEAMSGLLAMQIGTPTGEFHYLRVRVHLDPWGGFPDTVSLNVTQDQLDLLAGQPTDKLLCPKIYWSSVGG
jgi:hypothetical protein